MLFYNTIAQLYAKILSQVLQALVPRSSIIYCKYWKELSFHIQDRQASPLLPDTRKVFLDLVILFHSQACSTLAISQCWRASLLPVFAKAFFRNYTLVEHSYYIFVLIAKSPNFRFPSPNLWWHYALSTTSRLARPSQNALTFIPSCLTKCAT